VNEAVATVTPFGIWPVSEAEACNHCHFSRTVIREVLAPAARTRGPGQGQGRALDREALSARMLDGEHGLRVLLNRRTCWMPRHRCACWCRTCAPAVTQPFRIARPR
jgi:hypothetical protein